MNNYRVIHTGFYSQKAANILKGLFLYLDDYKSRRLGRSARKTKVIVYPDNEVVIECALREPYYYYPYTIWDRTNGNDAKALEWIAIQLKRAVIDNSQSDGVWSRLNDDVNVSALRYSENYDCDHPAVPTVAEVYYMYDSLIRRKHISKKYDKALIDRMHGNQLDPIATEMETARREEVKRLKLEHEQHLRDLECEKSQKMRDYRTQLDLEYERLRNEAVAKLESDIAALDEIAKLSA